MTTSFDLILRKNSEIFLKSFPASEKITSDNLIMTKLSPARTSITLYTCTLNISTSLCNIITSVLFPILPRTYFQLPIRINVEYVRHVQPDLQSSLCGNVSSILEGIYLGLDLRAEIPILSIGENSPWVTIKKSEEKFEVYGYRGKQDNLRYLREATMPRPMTFQPGELLYQSDTMAYAGRITEMYRY